MTGEAEGKPLCANAIRISDQMELQRAAASTDGVCEINQCCEAFVRGERPEEEDMIRFRASPLARANIRCVKFRLMVLHGYLDTGIALHACGSILGGCNHTLSTKRRPFMASAPVPDI